MNQAPQNMDHLNETMLYKCPGPHEIHGGHFDYVIVPEVDIEEAKAQGWHLTTTEARAAHEEAITAPPPALPVPIDQLDQVQDPIVAAPVEQLAPAPAPDVPPVETVNVGQLIENAAMEAPVTYDEMKTKATQLGLEYPGNISKAALLAMITAKLAEQV